MNFFESELRKIMGDGCLLDNLSFVGRACFGDVGENLRARVEFVTMGTVDHYDAFKVSILNCSQGVVDTLLLRFQDLFGAKAVLGNPNFPDGVIPHIGVYQNDPEWYAYKLTSADYKLLQRSVNDYVSVFMPREQGRNSLESQIKVAASEKSSMNNVVDGKETVNNSIFVNPEL